MRIWWHGIRRRGWTISVKTHSTRTTTLRAVRDGGGAGGGDGARRDQRARRAVLLVRRRGGWCCERAGMRLVRGAGREEAFALNFAGANRRLPLRPVTDGHESSPTGAQRHHRATAAGFCERSRQNPNESPCCHVHAHGVASLRTADRGGFPWCGKHFPLAWKIRKKSFPWRGKTGGIFHGMEKIRDVFHGMETFFHAVENGGVGAGAGAGGVGGAGGRGRRPWAAGGTGDRWRRGWRIRTAMTASGRRARSGSRRRGTAA